MIEYTCYGPPLSINGNAPPIAPGTELGTFALAADTDSAAFPDGTTMVIVLVGGADCRVHIASDPDARNTAPLNRKLLADTEYTFGTRAGLKINVTAA